MTPVGISESFSASNQGKVQLNTEKWRFISMSKNENADVIHICGDGEESYWLSEKAENRVAWLVSGAIFLMITPVLLLPLFM